MFARLRCGWQLCVRYHIYANHLGVHYSNDCIGLLRFLLWHSCRMPALVACARSTSNDMPWHASSHVPRKVVRTRYASKPVKSLCSRTRPRLRRATTDVIRSELYTGIPTTAAYTVVLNLPFLTSLGSTDGWWRSFSTAVNQKSKVILYSQPNKKTSTEAAELAVWR